MSNGFAKAFLSAKRDMDHSIAKAIKEAATRFYEQTGLVPEHIDFEMQFDCHDHGLLEYVVVGAKFDFNLDEVC